MKQSDDTPKGLALAILAYVLWGGLPIYMKSLSHVPALEIVAHRVLWSVPIAGLVLVALGRTSDFVMAIKHPRLIVLAMLPAALISLNWLTYVYAISADRALDAALGYYINPLFSVLLGFVILKERMTRLQMAALGFVFAAVALLTFEMGQLPWISLLLTVTWGFYALLKKSLPLGPNQGFLLEVCLMTPPAVGYLIFLMNSGQSSFGTISAQTTWLLAGAGAITAIPLMIYANGAKLLTLTTIAMLQYIAPTFIFLTAIFVFKEPFGWEKQIAFPMIWTGLAIYSASLFRNRRRK